MESEVDTLPETDATTIIGIPFVSVYVDDFHVAFAFYSDLLGLEKQYDMGENACFFRLGPDSGLYVEGGNSRAEERRDTARATFTLGVH
jgi:predicted enzyme related to lactoylglutathione lyase